jgi:hypothetical protein
MQFTDRGPWKSFGSISIAIAAIGKTGPLLNMAVDVRSRPIAVASYILSASVAIKIGM